MPSEKAIQIPYKDGNVYIYEPEKDSWFKFCPADSLPSDVKDVIRELKNKADKLKDAEQPQEG